jgi:predicted RNA-binding Zn-ribbon protein involved in translation (DUF1610 family)
MENNKMSILSKLKDLNRKINKAGWKIKIKPILDPRKKRRPEGDNGIIKSPTITVNRTPIEIDGEKTTGLEYYESLKNCKCPNCDDKLEKKVYYEGALAYANYRCNQCGFEALFESIY